MSHVIFYEYNSILYCLYTTEKGYVGRTFGGPLSDKYYGGNATFHFL